jgi:hypothetical protein
MKTYLTKVVYVSLFELDKQPDNFRPVSSNKTSGKVLRQPEHDIRTVMIDINKLSTIVSNGFKFMLVNHEEALDIYKEVHKAMSDLKSREEINLMFSDDNSRDDDTYSRYSELLHYIEENYTTYINKYRTGNLSVKRGINSSGRRVLNRKRL